MQDKQKVTLYFPPNLYRQLKIRAAIDSDSMSAMVEKAVAFYFTHPEIVEKAEASHGKNHQVHICPECDSSLVMQDGQLNSLKAQPSVINEDEFSPFVRENQNQEVQRLINSADEQELVPC